MLSFVEISGEIEGLSIIEEVGWVVLYTISITPLARQT